MEVKNFNVNSISKSDFPREPLFSFGLKLRPQLKQDKFEKTVSIKPIQPKSVSFGSWDNFAGKIISRSQFASASYAQRVDYINSLNLCDKVDKGVIFDLDKYTDIIKKELEKLAKGKSFQFISLGQSPATIAEVLDAKGVDTRLCPISKLQKAKKIIEEFGRSEDKSSGNKTNKKCRKKSKCKPAQEEQKWITRKQEPYFEYLKKHFNIDFDEMSKNKNKNKKYFIVDYTQTGRSLANFEDILKARKINCDNIHFIPLSALTSLAPEKDREFINYFTERYIQKFELKKDYSPIFTLNAKEAYKIAEVENNTPVNENYRNLKLYFLDMYVNGR